MSGIYIHIPFCKQACYYCDFHFSTSLKQKDNVIKALVKEIQLRKHELGNQIVETIYFGGGTPSVLNTIELQVLITAIYDNYTISKTPEITLEANPDDLSIQQIEALSKTKINRLSIGVQSFFDDDLKLMNRAHNAQEALKSIKQATQYFNNISIDLIYGIPNASNKQWEANIDTALSLGVPHISSYALTVEPKTALASFIQKGIINNVNDDKASEQFYILVDKLSANNFVHYELSNFGKKGFFSKNNSAYWQGKSYVGIGPSAHSFNGDSRSWNVKNNSIYVKTLQENKLPNEIEKLSTTDKYNEYVMTGLRTIWGVSLVEVENRFGNTCKLYLLQQAKKHISAGLLSVADNKLQTTKQGKFLCDGIASDLFKINLS